MTFGKTSLMVSQKPAGGLCWAESCRNSSPPPDLHILESVCGSALSLQCEKVQWELCPVPFLEGPRLAQEHLQAAQPRSVHSWVGVTLGLILRPVGFCGALSGPSFSWAASLAGPGSRGWQRLAWLWAPGRAKPHMKGFLGNLFSAAGPGRLALGPASKS